MRVALQVEANAFSVSLQELPKDGDFAGVYSEIARSASSFATAEEAFRYAITSLRIFLSHSQDDVAAVNSPCNCEFLTAHEQQKALTALGLAVVPSVNK